MPSLLSIKIAIPSTCSPNDLNTLRFNPIKTQQVRVVFTRNVAKGYYVGVTEMEIWSQWPQTSSPNTYEAEDAVITDANMEASSNASGGSFVGGIDGKSSSVEFSGVRSEITGNVNVRIYYANALKVDSTHTLLVNNLHQFTVIYPPTIHGWGHFDEKTYVTMELPLLKGDNVLLFKHALNSAELDRIYLEIK